ncbi:sulfurtransferase complex subunit TusD [Buchnera aphidicola]|uniref:Sulfurtransferase TusD n=1 Tax=Buchnera aphidicola (Artemisaphis artemisicola) TaxID=1241836 RepID=A0A4D6XGA5_9GAMM|nr:sulfurtransferase complex subunit TusD [Buchnera aphidicola]QCI16266.1 sulfurtransferase complex subunit TusD [Buchnera aphidicola (Artemisaphis artemisicola)]
MNYTILVTGSAYGRQNASTALLFCQSLVKTDHVLHSIFFYGDGVSNANKMIKPATDEFNLIAGWQKLHKKYKVKLYVCSSAAFRRGVIEDEQKINMRIKQGNLALFFEMTGLLELANSIKVCDRIIQF